MSIPKFAGRWKQVKNTAELYQHCRSILRMLADVFQGRYKMSRITSLVFLGGLAYILLPFDFDWIPLAGWIDDGFVGYWVIKRLLAETKRHAQFVASDKEVATTKNTMDIKKP